MSFLFLSFRSWFVGKIRRVDAENQLSCKNDGAFLIRESESAPGMMCMFIHYTAGK